MSVPATAVPAVALTHFAGRAGDHNDLAMVGSRELAAALGARLGVDPVVVGSPEPALSVGWEEELAAAMPTLRKMADRLDEVFGQGLLPVTASSRCAVALATLPVVARHRPDAVVVWFDAHADLNTPDNSSTGYLGGLAFSGPLGLWDSALGAGLATRNAVLVGARDIDAPEQELIDAETVALVEVGPSMADELRQVVGGRPVYVHIDCDAQAHDDPAPVRGVDLPIDHRVRGQPVDHSGQGRSGDQGPGGEVGHGPRAPLGERLDHQPAMNNVGLLYVGAVLLINGLMLLGRVPRRSADAMNLFVGALQCVTPTVLIIQARGNGEAILGASGLYLFGFTYLYVGVANLANLEPEGIGWFSLFVACAAVVFAGSPSGTAGIQCSGSSGSPGPCCGRCSSSCSVSA